MLLVLFVHIVLPRNATTPGEYTTSDVLAIMCIVFFLVLSYVGTSSPGKSCVCV